MNVCLCVSWYFPNSVGGTETYVQALARYLQQEGHDVIVLKPGHKDEENYFYEGIEIRSFFPGTDFKRRMYLGLQAPELTDFEEKLKATSPDVIHFHSLTGPSGISISHIEKARKIAAKVYFTFHLPHLTCATSTFKYLKKHDCEGVAEPKKCAECLFAHSGWPIPAAKALGAFSTSLNKRNIKVLGYNPLFTRLGSAVWIELRKEQLGKLSSLCDKLICLSSWFCKVLKKNGVPKEKLALFEQGVLMEVGKPVRKGNPQIDVSEPVRLVFLGRLDPIKGLSLLLSVIKEFDEEEFIIDLYGPIDQGYWQQLEPYFKKGNIQYKGILKREEILQTLSTYHAMVVPSLVTEMAPLVLQEAFAASIPAIASDVAGNAAFVIPNVNGWLFKSGNTESLKEVLSWLLKNKNELTKASNNMYPVRTIKDIGGEHLELYLS
ncbi:glycosyltransferase [Segetibacter aerophilus]|uniref:LPS biosynthesis protein RfbU n=1 Tax=Segetibacter aerophilus TaxID=670293 RepID=A0A512B6M7_9BACT|nr:glycosyltransferase [Segetibacter aerophilus]GEO07623.1 LPS biosynthesis protein RfbU [Segetibacter aerophilus]